MQVEIFHYGLDSGWSIDTMPPLDSPQTLVLIFAAPEFMDSPQAIHQLVANYPNSYVMGCSTVGEILGDAIYDHSLAVAVIRFHHSRLAVATAPAPEAQFSYAAGKAVAQELSGPDLRGVLVLSDGIHVNGSELIRGLNAVLDKATVVTGGLAGDGERFLRTWVLKEGVPCEGYVAAVGLYGRRLHVGHGSKGGWDIFGPERRVTSSKGNVLYKLDGKPALELYREYLGDQAQGLPATGLLFPLALRASYDQEATFVRTILAVNEEDQSLIFAGDIPQGYLAQLMKANFERLIDGAAEAALMTRQQASAAGPVLSIAISCFGRRMVLGQRTEEELEAVLDVLPSGIHQIGFYSYGEISPFANGQCDLHNQTMTLTTISED